MQDTKRKIAAGLEQAFARNGFADPSVEDLRDAAGVSLRTLYKYTPSRKDMILCALQYRHERYLSHLFDTDMQHASSLDGLLERIGRWMKDEAPQGCLFYAALNAHPHDEQLHSLLKIHKDEIIKRAIQTTGLSDYPYELALLFEGLTQNWSLHGEKSLQAAKQLGKALLNRTPV